MPPPAQMRHRAQPGAHPACCMQVYFKCNKKFIHQYPNIREYTKEVYQTPGRPLQINEASGSLCSVLGSHLSYPRS